MQYAAGAYDLSKLTQKSAYLTVTAQNFNEEVAQKSLKVPVLLHIGSERSPESVKLRDSLLTIADESQGKIAYAYVDADTTPEIAQSAGATALPTVVVLAAGQQLSRFEGNQPIENLRPWVAAVLEAVEGKLQPEDQPDPRFDEAFGYINEGQFDKAIAIYDSLLEENPSHAVARTARAQAILLQRTSTQDQATMEAAVAQKDRDNDAALLAADYLVLLGNAEQSFDILFERIQNTSGETQKLFKERYLELLELFEPDEEISLKMRSRLAAYLF